MTLRDQSNTQLEIQPDGRTKVERRRELERKAYRIPCPKCGAGVREICSSPVSGEPSARMHAARIRQATFQ